MHTFERSGGSGGLVCVKPRVKSGSWRKPQGFRQGLRSL